MEQQYIGIDLHKASFQACAVSADGRRLWEAAFPRTPDGLAAFAAREIAGAELAVEATGPTWRFVDVVQTYGARVCVVDARKTKLKAGFAAKTDRLDARRLAADPIARALTRLPGIGPVLGMVVRAEIGAIERFPRGAALACYAGIVPAVYASGTVYRSGAITRQGSPWLRWALVEVALHAMRQPDPLGRWARRLAIRKGIKRARVALARRLCDQIVHTWRHVG